jgi:hypothetical protein
MKEASCLIVGLMVKVLIRFGEEERSQGHLKDSKHSVFHRWAGGYRYFLFVAVSGRFRRQSQHGHGR